MAIFVDQRAAKDFAHFVDAIGELVAAVFDMNHGGAVQDVAAIDISYPAHARSRDFNEEERTAVPRPQDRGSRNEALRESGLVNMRTSQNCGSVMPVAETASSRSRPLPSTMAPPLPRQPWRRLPSARRPSSRRAACDRFQTLAVSLPRLRGALDYGKGSTEFCRRQRGFSRRENVAAALPRGRARSA